MKRQTRQRELIQQIFQQVGRPLGPQEVLQAAHASLPNLGLATVYRAVRELLDDGWLRSVELPGQPARYEQAHKRHHHHFHCRQCDSVFEVKGCLTELASLTPPGFQLEDHEVVLYGLCDRCKRPGKASG